MSFIQTTLFAAMDAATRLVANDCDLDETFNEIGPTRRRLDLADETWLTVDDQPVIIAGGLANFVDIHGDLHTMQFFVERQLAPEDLPKELVHG